VAVLCVTAEPEVITKVIEVDELAAPAGPTAYPPPYWPPVGLPQLRPGAGPALQDEAEAAGVEEEQTVDVKTFFTYFK